MLPKMPACTAGRQAFVLAFGTTQLPAARASIQRRFGGSRGTHHLRPLDIGLRGRRKQKDSGAGSGSSQVTMASFIGAALEGMSAEVASAQGLGNKLSKLSSVGGTLLKEIAGMALLAPFGIRSMATYRSVPLISGPLTAAQYNVKPVKLPNPGTIGVYLQHNISYGVAAANMLDVYVPAAAYTAKVTGESASAAVPVVVFVHGGVWASGERWHYAPMAVRLAQEGCIVVVPTYTLFPKALAGAMVTEVSAALTWVFDNIAHYGGDTGQVSLVGHSAGSHLAAMALLHRAVAAHQQQQQQQGEAIQASSRTNGGTSSIGSGSLSPPLPPHPQGLLITDSRMPCRFVGMSGVYDISRHYDFESVRGVAQISMMARAIGGRAAFAQLSPAIILASSALSTRDSQGDGHGNNISSLESDVPMTEEAEASYYDTYRLAGEAIPARSGIDTTATLLGKSARRGADTCVGTASHTVNGGLRHFPQAAAAHLPPCTIMSSCADHMVPWHEGAQMCWSLLACGVPSKHLIYNHAQHGDFIMAWHPRSQWKAGNSEQRLSEGLDLHELPGCAKDLVKVVTGTVEVQYMLIAQESRLAPLLSSRL